MKNKLIKRILSLVLIFALTVGYFPSNAFAGWDDGTECEFCGGYRFEDWLCDCGPHCSENSDSVDCYLAHHCANCLEACEADEKCDECEFCPECWEEHCAMCGVHVDGLCDGCNVCDTCQIDMGTHCYECGECMSELSECSDHPFNIYQDNHCEFCSMQCSECGMCFSEEYEDVFCESCSFCFSCAVDYGLHCPNCYECKEGEICDECKICPECGIEEVTHCPECGEHVEEWCDRGGLRMHPLHIRGISALIWNLTETLHMMSTLEFVLWASQILLHMKGWQASMLDMFLLLTHLLHCLVKFPI